MEFYAVYHRADDNYCYPLDENRLIINIITGYDVKYVNIIHGDPFEKGLHGWDAAWSGQSTNISLKKRLQDQLWWTITIKPPFKRLKYYFELHTETEVWYYFEDGFVSKDQIESQGKNKQCFRFPWLNPSDVAIAPSWVKDTIWYEIFLDRFCNGDKSLDTDVTLPWKEEGSVSNCEVYGGDIPGIISKLDYLRELGITGIYLTPINESPSTHKYDTRDYEKIDSHFGNATTMKNFVRKAHERGIRVMLDCVFNHTGEEFAPWIDVKKNGQNSKYFNWFIINEWPFSKDGDATRRKQYYSFAFFDNMPKLNTNNIEVRNYLIGLCEKWVKDYDVDGIRLDAANEISHTFSKELRIRLKAVKPDIYILGEIWHDSMPWLRGDEFDSVMNYLLEDSIKNFWIDKSITNEDFEYTINRCYTRYMQQTNDALFNMLDSHDTKRLRSEVNNLDEFFQELCVLFAMPGSPCIYYGTEIAMEGSYDPDCRRCMPWTAIESGKYSDTMEIVKSLIKLRKEEPLLRNGNLQFTNTINKPRVIQFQKVGMGENYIEIIINCESENVVVENKGEKLFSRHYIDNELLSGGILIRKLI